MSEITQNLLIGQYGSENFQTMGYLIWWNSRNIELSLKELKQKLETHRFNQNIAKEHNFRSTLIRSLKEMETQRIIRQVLDNGNISIYQFTSENLEGIENEAQYQYQLETKITIDKKAFSKNGELSTAIQCEKTNVKTALIQYLENIKEIYTSQDLTRLIKKILSVHADIVLLRDQGCLYFVPAAYRNIVENLQTLLSTMNCELSIIPLPNLKEMQKMVGTAVESELDSSIENINKQITKAMEEGKGSKWFNTRLNTIKSLKERLSHYESIIDSTKINNIVVEIDKVRERANQQARFLMLEE